MKRLTKEMTLSLCSGRQAGSATVQYQKRRARALQVPVYTKEESCMVCRRGLVGVFICVGCGCGKGKVSLYSRTCKKMCFVVIDYSSVSACVE